MGLDEIPDMMASAEEKEAFKAKIMDEGIDGVMTVIEEISTKGMEKMAAMQAVVENLNMEDISSQVEQYLKPALFEAIAEADFDESLKPGLIQYVE
jgi:predicted ATP-dependent Lon-type protease